MVSWIPTIHQQTKYFCRPFAACLEKAEVPQPPSRISLKTSSGTRRKSFHNEDLFDLVRAALTDTCNSIDFGKEEVFPLREVAEPSRGLKFRKAAGEDKIQLEILTALNGEEVRWLTRVSWGSGNKIGRLV